MKRILLIAATLLAAVVSATAISPDIQQIVETGKANCPVQIISGLTQQSIDYDESMPAIIVTLDVDEQQTPMSHLKEGKDMLHDMLATDLATSSRPEQQAIAKACVKNGVNLVYRYKGAGESFDIVITPADLQ